MTYQPKTIDIHYQGHTYTVPANWQVLTSTGFDLTEHVRRHEQARRAAQAIANSTLPFDPEDTRGFKFPQPRTLAELFADFPSGPGIGKTAVILKAKKKLAKKAKRKQRRCTHAAQGAHRAAGIVMKELKTYDHDSLQRVVLERVYNLIMDLSVELHIAANPDPDEQA